MTEKEMYILIMSNYDELIKFSKKLKTVKENQQYLEFKPVVGKLYLLLYILRR